MNHKKLTGLFVVVFFAISGCQKELQSEALKNGYLKFTFHNMVDSMPMQLGETYQNAFGEAYTISMFKYYISNIMLREPGGATRKINGVYHLVDEYSADTRSFVISVPGSGYSEISFLIGVDSARNVSGTQTGDLDPLKGMFWTWNSGYVMAKLEATSPQSTAPNNNISIHVGGFKTGENTLRNVSPSFPAGSAIRINNGDTSEIVLEANANAWFQGVHDLPVKNNPVCTSAGELATKFADNYANMFRITSINN